MSVERIFADSSSTGVGVAASDTCTAIHNIAARISFLFLILLPSCYGVPKAAATFLAMGRYRNEGVGAEGRLHAHSTDSSRETIGLQASRGNVPRDRKRTVSSGLETVPGDRGGSGSC
jgi:hypothetical protein